MKRENLARVIELTNDIDELAEVLDDFAIKDIGIVVIGGETGLNDNVHQRREIYTSSLVNGSVKILIDLLDKSRIALESELETL